MIITLSMFDWAVAVSICVSVLVGAFLASVLLSNFIDVSQRVYETDLSPAEREMKKVKLAIANLKSETNRNFAFTQMMLAVNAVLQIFNSLLQIPVQFVGAFNFWFSNRNLVVFAVVLTIVSFILMEDGDVVLTQMDLIYRCAVSPVVNNYLLNAMHLAGVIYASIAPIWNLVFVVLRQLVIGSFFILTKCGTSVLTIYGTVTAFVNIFKEWINETLRFIGLSNPDGIDGSSNFLVNTYNFVPMIKAIRIWLQWIPEGLSCMCEGRYGSGRKLFMFAFYPLYIDNFEYTFHHYLNAFISFGQTIIGIMPPFLTYPNFERTFYHVNSFAWDFGQWLDRWIVAGFEYAMHFFKYTGDLTIRVENNGYPLWFTTGYRALGSFASVLEVGANTTLHVFAPLDEKPITDHVFYNSIMSLNKAAAQVDLAVASLANIFAWVLRNTMNIIMLTQAFKCRSNPTTCLYYSDGVCSLQCSSQNSVVFKEVLMRCDYTPNREAAYNHNLRQIEAMDSAIFKDLEAYDQGFFVQEGVRSCIEYWDQTKLYEKYALVAYSPVDPPLYPIWNHTGNSATASNLYAFICKSDSCYYDPFQQNVKPTTACSPARVSCWEIIPLSNNALSACPQELFLNVELGDVTYGDIRNNMTVTLTQCQQYCNSTELCKTFDWFDTSKYSAEIESDGTRSCGLQGGPVESNIITGEWGALRSGWDSYGGGDNSMFMEVVQDMEGTGTTPWETSAIKRCHFPVCKLYNRILENTNIYIKKTRTPRTVYDGDTTARWYTYTHDGVDIMIGSNKLKTACDANNTLNNIPADGCGNTKIKHLAVENYTYFEKYTGYPDIYTTNGQKLDEFTTEQSVFLGLEREILTTRVKELKDAVCIKIMFGQCVNVPAYEVYFKRTDPHNKSDIIWEVEGGLIAQDQFVLGGIRDKFKEVYAPSDGFDFIPVLPCAFYHFAKAGGNIAFVTYELVLSWFWNGQDPENADEFSGKKGTKLTAFETLRQYVGPMGGRDDRSICNRPPPLYKTRVTYSQYTNRWQPSRKGERAIGFYYDPYCGQPNYMQNVFKEMDKGMFFLSSAFQQDTFGKLIFNVGRIAIEGMRFVVRFLYEYFSFEVFEFLAGANMGCGFTYPGNKTGSCNRIAPAFSDESNAEPCALGYPDSTCQCRVDDPSLDYNTSCACIWLPAPMTDGNLEAYTNIAVSHWCGINNLEFFYVYVSRVTDAIRKIVDMMQNTGGTGFPPVPDVCEVDDNDAYTPNGQRYTLWAQSTVNIIFGGVHVRNFDRDTTYTCDVKGNLNFACSLGGTFEKLADAIIQLIRKTVRNAFSIINGELDAIDVDLTQEICNVQRFEGQFTSMVGTVMQGAGSPAEKKATTALVYAFVDIIAVFLETVELIVKAIRAIFLMDPKVLETGAALPEAVKRITTSNAPGEIMFLVVTKMLRIIFEWLKQLLEACARTGDANPRGSGAAFRDLKQIVVLVEEVIYGGVLPATLSVFWIGLRVVTALFQPQLITGDNLVQLLTDIFDFLFKVINLMLQQGLRLLNAILTMMGAFGDVMKAIIIIICRIQEVLSTITFGGWEKVDCTGIDGYNPDQSIGDDIVDFTGVVTDVLDDIAAGVADAAEEVGSAIGDAASTVGGWFGFRRRLLAEAFQNKTNTSYDTFVGNNFTNTTGLTEDNLPRFVYLYYGWHGNAFCDHHMALYSNYSLNDMRPLEHLRWLECLEWRITASQLRVFTGLKSIPEDLLYNWKRPIALSAQVLRASIIYAQWYFGDGVNIKNLKKSLEVTGLHSDDVLRVVHVLKRVTTQSFNSATLHKFMLAVFSDNDKDFMNPENTGDTAILYRTYNNMTNAIGGVYDIVTSDSFYENQRIAKKHWMSGLRVPELQKHFRLPSTHEILSKNTMQTVNSMYNVPDTFGKIYTDLTCAEDHPFCLDCAIVDNFVYAWFDHLRYAGNFYENEFNQTIIHAWSEHWYETSVTNQRYSKAYKAAQSKTYGRTFYEEEPNNSTTWENKTYWYSNGQDWLDYFNGLLNGTRNYLEFEQATSYWFQGNHTGQIPYNATLLFPGDFQTVIEFPFRSDCVSSGFMWERQINSPAYAFLLPIVLFAIMQWIHYFVFALDSLQQAFFFFAIINSAIIGYPIIVYGYNPLCFPQIPVYLVYDLTLFIDEFFIPCFCTWVPYLSTNCNQQSCDTCSDTIGSNFTGNSTVNTTTPILLEYQSCKDVATGFEQLSPYLLWHFVFFIRMIWPQAFAFLASINVFPLTFFFDIPGIRELANDCINQVDVTGAEINCFFVNITSPIAAIIILYLLFFGLAPIITVTINLITSASQVVFNLILSTYYLAKASEVD